MTQLRGVDTPALDLTHEIRRAWTVRKARIHMQTQIVNMPRADNPWGSESPQYCRTEKRISDHG